MDGVIKPVYNLIGGGEDSTGDNPSPDSDGRSAPKRDSVTDELGNMTNELMNRLNEEESKLKAKSRSGR